MKLYRTAMSKHLFVLLVCLTCLFISSCSKNDFPEKTASLDYTIVTKSDFPDELKKLIKERKENDFELTYSDNSCLYIIKGFGKQRSGGYNIKVKQFYLSKDNIVFETELSGPKKNAKYSKNPSYPYIVIKTEFREEPVSFY